jgi:glycosyltransferase involved in cell wall biosynthesis
VTLQICTIIAKNYVAAARVLARSVAKQHPGSRLWALVIDEVDGYINSGEEPFELLTPADIGCEPFTQMALRYSVVELSTAVKPWLLRHLMGVTGRPVTYLDPDIKVYGSLERLDDLAARHGVVLTPHNSRPIPQDGRKPSQVDIMIAGIYNLGYVSVAPREEVDRLLDWWSERLTRDCRVDPVWGYFVDQRWFDLAPGFLSDLKIVRDPEYNLAYWNLHERRLERDGERYLVDGRPLAFFHFSGFDPRHPLVMSRHQDRIDVGSSPVLEGLLADYASELRAAGHDRSREWPYSYAALGDGTALDDTLRGLYDEFVDESGDGAPSPFTLQGVRAFERWTASQAPDAPVGVSRALHYVYQRRSDLRRAYAGAGGPDAEGLLRWAREHGEREEPVLARLALNGAHGVPGDVRASPEGIPTAGDAPVADGHGSPRVPTAMTPIGERDPRPSQPDTSGPLHQDPWGVNVVGYFRSEAGTGEAARQIVTALDAASVPVLPIHGQTIPVSRQSHPYETATTDDAPFPVNLICVNADMLPEFAQQAGADFFAERYSVGLWFWEISQFPERWRDSFSLLEEVWAPTEHIARTLEPIAPIPVNTVRIPVAPGSPALGSPAQVGFDETKFTFVFSFDYLSVARRKNPLGVVEAFRRAFGPGAGAELVIKCINSDRDPGYHRELQATIAGHEDITLIDRYMSPAENSSLPALCDCYVSLHRAEGFGLVMADAMWHGKPVIATGYSGNLDFMTDANSLLVKHEIVPIGEGAAPYPPDAMWAEPDVEHAAALMRQVFDDREATARLGATAADSIRRTHSAAAAGEILHRRLESIRGTGRVRPSGFSAAKRSPAMASLPLRVRQGPASGAPSGRRARGLARKVTLRVVRPYSVYQQAVNRHVAAAMEELNERVAEARREAGESLARVLAELRAARELRPELDEQARRLDELERRLASESRRGSAT